MHLNRGVIKIGMEVEVAKWEDTWSYQRVAKRLLDQEYMIGSHKTWEKHHTYHCSCTKGGCQHVRNGTLMVPPIVSITYDATLPEKGAEFITSPVLMSENGLAHLRAIWEEVASHAVWSNSVQDINGRPSSPSVHLHVSATLARQKGIDRSSQLRADILNALSLFAPELFAFADMADVRRGVLYRLPSRDTIYDDPSGTGEHHGFVQVRQAQPGKMVYVEWRLFEAAYESWEYLETMTYLAATLTRAMLNPNTMKQLLSSGYGNPYDEVSMRRAVAKDSTEHVLEQLNAGRLDTLRQLIDEQLDDDDYARAMLLAAHAQIEALI